MTAPRPARADGSFGALLRLCFPIVAVNVGMMLMGVVDTLMVGRLSAEALAAVGLGNVYYFAVSMLGLGVLLALDPVIAQALGAGDRDVVARAVQRGSLLAALLTAPLALLLAIAGPLLTLARQPAEIVPMAALYCAILIPGVLPFLLFSVGRQTLQAHHRVGPVLWTIVVANLINLALNQLLIFGGLGVPALGVAGSAWATTVSRCILPLALFFLARRDLLPLLRPWHQASWQRAPLLALFRLGVPIALQLELEMAAFSIVALLMGTFGTIQVAGHQIALNLASLTFMVPMGVGMAAAVLVGHAVGRGDRAAAAAAVRHALQAGVGFMAVTALIFLAVPAFFAGLYTSDPAVRLFAASLLPIAGVFQVFDGIQVVCVGILRGMGDTRAPMLINLGGFGVVGIGASLLLGYRTPLGPVGLWWGLVIGLATVAVVLVLRVRVLLRGPMRRV